MKRILLVVMWLFMSVVPAAADDAAFQTWLQDFSKDAVAQGVAPETLQRVLPTLSFDESVVELDRQQPEGRQTLAHYLHNVLPQARIDRGRAVLRENREVLVPIARSYGVPPEVVVALWGIESGFGDNMGDYDIINSIATLAYDGRRADLFRGELIEAFRIMDEERLAPGQMQGSWAGAMGQCQFMPSTFSRYAVDADHDGHRDIWSSEPDVWGSIANYITAEGWKAGQPWGREVRLTQKNLGHLVGLQTVKSIDAWAGLGVRSLSGKSLPSNHLSASLIQPDGPGGRAFLVYDNFRALMRWNHSTYFALSVGLLADALSSGS